MRIEKLVLPTPFPVGPINVYLIVDEPITLVDTGPKTDEAIAALRAGLSRLGFAFSDIGRIILTHTHEDHCGLAAMLQRESGARVYVHEWEHRNITTRGMTRANRRLLERSGVPAEEMVQIASRYEQIHQFADVVEDAEAFRDEPGRAKYQGGIRWIVVANRFEVYASYGNRFGMPSDGWSAIIGIRVQTPAILP